MAALRAHGAPARYFTFAALEQLGLPHATTTRHCPGLDSADPAAPWPAEARAALRPAGLDLTRVAWARQVHGADVAAAPECGGFAGVADVLVSTTPGLPLAIFTADCLALIVWDPVAGVLALAHVGWRGLVGGAAEATVRAVSGVGGRPERAHVAISPSIGPCCYEVDEPVAERFAAAYGPASWARWAQAAAPGRWRLDLWTAAEDLLAGAGVARDRIVNGRLCTACRPDLLYSYRRGHRGRLATVAALPGRPAPSS